MIDWLYGWVKNIAFYLILITAVLNVIPNNSYKKYVKLFTGMVLILLLISPLTELLGVQDWVDFRFDTKSYELEVESAKSSAKYFDQVQTGYLTGAYQEQVEERIGEIVQNHGVYPVEVKAVIEEDLESEDYGQLTQVDLVIAYEEPSASDISVDKIRIGGKNEEIDSYEQIAIKNGIEDFYNISGSNINISIQR